MALDALILLLLQSGMILKLYNMPTRLAAWPLVTFFLMSSAVGEAEPMREVTAVPDDCRSLLPKDKRGTLQSWKVFVQLEHCDRIKRLKRLSSLLAPHEQPLFYEGVIPSSRLPEEIGVDIPVLRVVFPDRAFFDTAKFNLRPEAYKILDIVAENLRKEPPDVALFIAGHADKRGGRDYNEALSIDRANSIAEEIYLKGINFSSIWRIGFGEDMPLKLEENDVAYAANRRVEFLFAAKPTALAVWLSEQQLDEICSARNRQEADNCKERLDLKEGYDVVEVKFQPKPPKSIVSSGKVKANIKVTEKDLKKIDTFRMARDKVEPVGARRIRIEPRNRRVNRVRVEL
jgi:outer membrane protein OmpA-like peptidoglycan-associated protein